MGSESITDQQRDERAGHRPTTFRCWAWRRAAPTAAWASCGFDVPGEGRRGFHPSLAEEDFGRAGEINCIYYNQNICIYNYSNIALNVGDPRLILVADSW